MSSTKTSSKHFPFARLPAELRNKVYERYIEDLDSHIVESRYRRPLALSLYREPLILSLVGQPLDLSLYQQPLAPSLFVPERLHRRIPLPPLSLVSHAMFNGFWGIMFKEATFTCRFCNATTREHVWNETHHVLMPLTGNTAAPCTTQNGLRSIHNVKLDVVALLGGYVGGGSGAYADTQTALDRVQEAALIVVKSCIQEAFEREKRKASKQDKSQATEQDEGKRTLVIDLRNVFGQRSWIFGAPQGRDMRTLLGALPRIVDDAATAPARNVLQTTIRWVRPSTAHGQNCAQWLREYCQMKGITDEEYTLTTEERRRICGPPFFRNYTITARDKVKHGSFDHQP
ncbi:hypothetical protein NA57DRAFT_55939 [Rhizodiscina lignyota]|uniref:Uncharacterized protein n=1 Tax=Rhizodiscina lignyota TaxID=1504668 RepID=A0A9P4IHB8_9PEZI|nr:hypothetical protein NA57DRAFT_55939 [Rhizodiscina lignyota]